jgi:hypothetical protein
MDTRTRIRNVSARWTACLLCTLTPALAHSAPAWSSCQTITALTDYIAYSNSISLVLSPGIPNCNGDTTGTAIIRVGQFGVTADGIKSLFATANVAFVTGKRVMVYYDNSTPSCFSSIISVGGYSGQCP